ncbi:MAG TPA: TIGR03086 family metal-binding protein [Nocardioidaceae bacterium]|nr:TIGR03086 family metal-binding protein [Nocardioidaceae bacterium]
MTTPAQQSIDVLSRALDQTANVLSAIRSDELSADTPCSDWDVARLVAHVVADPHNIMLMSTGGEPDWSAEPPLPEDWTAEFRKAADELLGMWNESGEAATPQGVDWQTAEFAVHAWDLARATGQSTDFDPEVAQRGLDFMSAALTSENRGKAFGPAVSIAEDAPVYDRLVAFAGRDPR